MKWRWAELMDECRTFLRNIQKKREIDNVAVIPFINYECISTVPSEEPYLTSMLPFKLSSASLQK